MEKTNNGFIKKDVVCPKCGKILLKGYGKAVLTVTCKCGGTVVLHARQVRK